MCSSPLVDVVSLLSHAALRQAALAIGERQSAQCDASGRSPDARRCASRRPNSWSASAASCAVRRAAMANQRASGRSCASRHTPRTRRGSARAARAPTPPGEEPSPGRRTPQRRRRIGRAISAASASVPTRCRPGRIGFAQHGDQRIVGERLGQPAASRNAAPAWSAIRCASSCAISASATPVRSGAVADGRVAPVRGHERAQRPRPAGAARDSG